MILDSTKCGIISETDWELAHQKREKTGVRYEKKYQDMETRLYRLYDEIEGVENSIEEVKNRLLNIKQQKISEENIYQFLLYFDKLYDKFTDLEKKEFLNSFIEQVDIYEREQLDQDENAIWSLMLANRYLKASQVEYRGILRESWYHLQITKKC